jgi:hypothetical protein
VKACKLEYLLNTHQKDCNQGMQSHLQEQNTAHPEHKYKEHLKSGGHLHSTTIPCSCRLDALDSLVSRPIGCN